MAFISSNKNTLMNLDHSGLVTGTQLVKSIAYLVSRIILICTNIITKWIFKMFNQPFN